MAGFYNLDHKEVIRVKVKKCDGKMQPEYKKFSIDPQITSFEMLQGILARAFDIHSDFTISYLARDSEGQAVFLSMLSDWDMDAAFQCAADPCLKLKVDLRPFEEELEDWDVIGPAEIPQHRISSLLDKNSLLGSITGTITHNLGKTVNSVQKAMGLKQAENEVIKPIKPPMSDMEFHNYLDSAGFMVKPNEFRFSIYQGGIEPSLRRVAWRHLLNIYPFTMSGKDRFDYMKRKEEEYRKLRDEWRDRFKNNTATEEVKYVASMVKKDVLRTDRSHGFYAGNDDNENTLSLFHILVTYALTHPDVSYCQGMSDLASPLLVTQKDEGQAYICFCALMNRLRENFTIEGNAIMTKFRHLSDLLAMYDPVLYTYLIQNSAGDMFFCYRWFLLELKREFPFTDALYVLEVMWATLPPNPPERELLLVDPDYSSRLLSSSPCSPTFSFQQAMYAKLLAMRRVGALHNVTQSALRISKPSPRASANNNLSAETSPNLMNANAATSFDTSPGDTDDRGADFPQVDNPLTRSMQRKSNSIDQVLQDGASVENQNTDVENEENENDSNVEEKSGDEDKDIDGEAKEGRMENGECEEDENPSNEYATTCNTVIEYSNHCDSGPTSSADVPNIPVEACSGFKFTEEADNEGRRSWSVSSSAVSDSSEMSEQQIQFSLSLDSNTNNSTEVLDSRSESKSVTSSASSTTSDSERNNVIYTKSDIPSAREGNDNNTESNQGLFQSMKRLLASPKRRPFNIQDPAPGHAFSPKRGGPDGKHHSSPALTPAKEKTELLTKNFSDSNLSDCQEATESMDNSVNSSSSNIASKPPVRDPSKLPPPHEFGAGNPFLLFVCLTLLIQHREAILSQGMCYEEIAMHFDRLVRRHNSDRVLHHARQMYTEYLKAQQAKMEKEKDVEEYGSSC